MQMKKQLHPHFTQKSTTLRVLSRKDTKEALWWRGCPADITHTLLLTLLGGNAGVLLTLCPPVGHGLEAAGTYGVASLQGAHVTLS